VSSTPGLTQTTGRSCCSTPWPGVQKIALKTKTLARHRPAAVLEKLEASITPWCRSGLDPTRTLSKLKAPYGDALATLVSRNRPRSHRLQPGRWTATGRLIQQPIPHTTADTSLFPHAVQPPASARPSSPGGWQHDSARIYPQIELRIAHPPLRRRGAADAYSHGDDVHSPHRPPCYSTKPIFLGDSQKERRWANKSNFGL